MDKVEEKVKTIIKIECGSCGYIALEEDYNHICQYGNLIVIVAFLLGFIIIGIPIIERQDPVVQNKFVDSLFHL